MSWQAMDSAPKDGTNIIVTKFGWVVDDLTDWTLCYHGPWWISQAYWHEKKKCWSDGLERLCEPTHWMPVPKKLPDPVEGPQGCKVPPRGWFCTRLDGHDGPCAAHPVTDALSGKAYPAHTYQGSDK